MAERSPTRWRCPKCGRRIPHRNAVHVCRPPVPVGEHFRGKSPRIRQLYGAFRSALKKIGPVHVDSTRTRIAFALEIIFLELTPQAKALRGCLLLPRLARHPRFFRSLSASPRLHYHFFKLTEPHQLDRRFRRLLAEGYQVGRREHLRESARSKQISPSPVAAAGGERRAFVDTSRPLWRCPKCGNYFVSRNLWHSCVRVPLASHFKGKHPLVWKTFNALLAALRQNGPLRVVSSKTRIAFMVRMRFAGVQPQKDALRGSFILTRRARHPRIFNYHYSPPRYHLHQFRLSEPRQLDRRFRQLLAKAYQVGQQKHLERAKR